MTATNGTVRRIDCRGEMVTMSKGLGNSYQTPRFRALVYDSQGRYVADVNNSSILCLPGGSVQAPNATDQQILDAVLGDESIYGEQS
jgi:hypothetical protein